MKRRLQEDAERNRVHWQDE